MQFFKLVICSLAIGWCTSAAVAARANPNVLLIVADDLGVDQVGVYQGSGAASLTPRIDRLATNGLRFTNAWSNPLCSPTRATMLTGRYGFRTGVGWILAPDTGNTYAIRPNEYTLPRALATLGVKAANIGKWHLGNGARGPNIMGFEHYSGWTEGKLPDYFNWTKVTNGVQVDVQNYATSETVDDALSWINQQSGPWVLWLAFNAPHVPYHKPPNALHRFDDLPTDPEIIEANPRPYYLATVQALDTEIGRLLDSLDADTRANTMVIFLSDNGAPGEVTQEPNSSFHAKGTLYQGGVNVPLIVSGALVRQAGRNIDSLVNTTDIFATILDAVGFNLSMLPSDRYYDSVSFLPYIKTPASDNRRTVVFAEQFQIPDSSQPFLGKTMRTRRHKLLQFEDGTEEFYDIFADPFEENDLLLQGLTRKQQRAYDGLVHTTSVLLSTEQ